VTEWLANISVKWVLVITGLLLVIRMTLPRARQLPKAWADSVSEFVESALIAIVLVFLVIRPFVVQAFYIPSGSMRMTLLEQDRILVNKFIFRVRAPQREEIVVFRAPPQASPDEKDFIKRVIGLPGDTIEVRPDAVTIDGKTGIQLINSDAVNASTFRPESSRGLPVDKYGKHQVEKDRILIPTQDGAVPVIASPTGSIAYEDRSVLVDGVERAKLTSLNLGREAHSLDALGADPGVEGTVVFNGEAPVLIVLRGSRLEYRAGHIVVNNQPRKEAYIAQTPRYAMAPFQVPSGHLFVMGDNRNDSNDSHAWGPLDLDRVVGKAMFIFWPPNRIGIVH
jgi:signal peptidase I